VARRRRRPLVLAAAILLLAAAGAAGYAYLAFAGRMHRLTSEGRAAWDRYRASVRGNAAPGAAVQVAAAPVKAAAVVDLYSRPDPVVVKWLTWSGESAIAPASAPSAELDRTLRRYFTHIRRNAHR
jgi:hypothetical protein